jgi:ribosomal protein S18 acetylase RimI-like enzyme
MLHMRVREAREQDHLFVESLILESFEPVTWAKTLEERFGLLNGLDWQARWKLRLRKVFAEQTVLLGETDDGLAAVSTSTLDRDAALVWVDILAVARSHQRHGYGREMLKATMQHFSQLGAKYVHLDCLTNNEKGNALYQSEGFEEVARHIRWFRRI